MDEWEWQAASRVGLAVSKEEEEEAMKPV